ncbi:hypothetical protein HN51_044970 [Arachis hypogaea]
MEREDEDATRERRLFRRALSSLLGSIEAAAAARACRAPVLTFGFYDYFLCFIGAVFDAKGADSILSFEKFCCNLPRPLLQVPEERLWELGRRQLDTYFLLAHMCSVKLKEWMLVQYSTSISVVLSDSTSASLMDLVFVVQDHLEDFNWCCRGKCNPTAHSRAAPLGMNKEMNTDTIVKAKSFLDGDEDQHEKDVFEKNLKALQKIF